MHQTVLTTHFYVSDDFLTKSVTETAKQSGLKLTTNIKNIAYNNNKTVSTAGTSEKLFIFTLSS